MAAVARLAIPVLVAGCSFNDRPVSGDGGGDDAASVEFRCQDWTFTPAEVAPCDLPAPKRVDLVAAATYVLNSQTGALAGPGGVTVMLPYTMQDGIGIVSVIGLDVPIGTTLRAEGTLPLVIASWKGITVAGKVSVASVHPDRNGMPTVIKTGAGGGSPQCPTGADVPQPGTADGGGDGGGGGGGFGGAGGKGGTGGGSGGSTGGNGGVARNQPMRIEGGCTGAAAAAGADGTPGTGGPGGGAIALIAKDTVTILGSGIVEAGGAGGNGGETGRTGGGGGGSGGMIKLETRDLRVTMGAVLAANGGQGGGGSGGGGRAGPGVDGRPDAMRATSTNRDGNGTSGGGGGFSGGSTGETVTAVANDGAGGGGGGVGYIVYRAYGATTLEPGSIVSPSAIPF